jgi:hypothetical protein
MDMWLSLRTKTTKKLKTTRNHRVSFPSAGPSAKKIPQQQRCAISVALVLHTVVFVTLQMILLWNLDRCQEPLLQQHRPWLGDATTNINHTDDSLFFSACLLTMEDDVIGLLHEWLAYHYTKLPLRRLIVAHDPRSRAVVNKNTNDNNTNTNIFQRWNNINNSNHNRHHGSRPFIDITEWTDRDYFPVSYRSAIIHKKQFNSTADQLTALHRFRQRFFYFKCLRQLKRERQRQQLLQSSLMSVSPIQWVALIDSDEFLNIPNPNWKHYQEIQRQWNKNQQKQLQHQHQKNLTSMTVLEFLQRLQGHPQIQQPCIPVPRLLFSAKEELKEEEDVGNVINQPSVPSSFYLDGADRDQHLPSRDLAEVLSSSSSSSSPSLSFQDFVTLRWHWHGSLDDTNLNHAGKALVDISRIPISALSNVDQTDIHRPVLQYCHADDVWIRNVDSALVLHHYTGRWDQWSFRSDPRQLQQQQQTQTQKQTQKRRTRDRFEAYLQASHWIDTSITPSWLEDFVSQVGIDQARMLLEGTGRIHAVAVTMPRSHNNNNISSSELSNIYAGLVYPNITNINITRFP